MKKLVFMFVAVAAISFASCGNKTAQAEAVDSDSIAVVDSADVLLTLLLLIALLLSNSGTNSKEIERKTVGCESGGSFLFCIL